MRPVGAPRSDAPICAAPCSSAGSAKPTSPSEQESEELGDEVIARLNPRTGEVENLEVLFFSTRLLRSNVFELPVSAELRVAASEDGGPADA